MATRHPVFCFQPTDQELFSDYLMRRLNEEPLPDPNLIRDCDVYGGGEPWKIFDKDRGGKFYVFTVLKKKNRSRVDRTAGSGSWKEEQSSDFKDLQGDVIGYKKLFTFKPKAGSSAKADKAENGHWIMYEYSKHPRNETDRVLCVIHNKYAGEARKRVRRNLHGPVQLEEENPRAKKAQTLRDDHTYAIDVPATASPSSTTAAAQAQPSTSSALNEDGVFIPRNNISFTTRNANSLPPTWANVQEDTRPAGAPAYGGPNGGPFSIMGMAAPRVDWEWADRLKKMEISPTVKHLFCAVVEQRARALHGRMERPR
ncbi:NAC domain-containing protein 68-like [Eucalyptus grandis]|uniref:NAC domain-containing protein 68-like n=1 Tax=Eucalyptus grandis TaxID=71139 RepID=UPI00192EDBB1|nr:NAC domain-containing protein 68-like [Eucalyptus grandis]